METESPDTRCLRVRFPADLIRRLRHVAADREASLRELIEEAALALVERHEAASRSSFKQREE